MKYRIWSTIILMLYLSFVNLKEINSKTKNRDIEKNKQQRFLHVQLCMSWSYTRYYEDLKNFVDSRFNDVHMSMEQYPLTPTRQILSNLVILIQIISFSMIIFVRRFQPYLCENLKQISEEVEQNKVIYCIAIFMSGIFVQNMLANTGAFEVFLNGEQIWSKLDTGKPIDPKYLIKLLQNNE